MNSSICTVLAMFCSVLVIVNVNGQRGHLNIVYKKIPLLSSQNHWPIRPSLNIYDPRNFNEMKVNYRTNTNSDMEPIFIRGEPIKFKVKKKPFEFEYEEQHLGSLLQMNMSFKLASNVHRGFVFIRSSLRDDTTEKIFEIRRPNLSDKTDKVANIQWYVTKEHVYIDVKLHNKTGVCLYKRISHGKMLDQRLSTSDLKSPITDTPNCFYGNICEIEVDLRKECRGAKITENSNYNIILTVIFATALVVIAIVAFFKCCWVKRDAQVPQLLPCSPPFYVNLLYRRECQEIIDNLEQNQYELID